MNDFKWAFLILLKSRKRDNPTKHLLKQFLHWMQSLICYKTMGSRRPPHLSRERCLRQEAVVGAQLLQLRWAAAAAAGLTLSPQQGPLLLWPLLRVPLSAPGVCLFFAHQDKMSHFLPQFVLRNDVIEPECDLKPVSPLTSWQHQAIDFEGAIVRTRQKDWWRGRRRRKGGIPHLDVIGHTAALL